MAVVAEPVSKPKSLARFLPNLVWLPAYKVAWLGTDLVAGLTVVALLIPEGMAYAQIAGVPPEAAFYAAPIGLLMFAIFGTSRQLVVAGRHAWCCKHACPQSRASVNPRSRRSWTLSTKR